MSTVFRRAYELVAASGGEGPHRYSCDAIHAAAGGKDNALGSRCPQAGFFWREHFTPAGDSPESYWLASTGMTEVEKHEWRLTGLALAAAITRSEGT
jgi:hypothetical protein